MARWLARLHARIFGRTYKLTYHPNSSGLVFISHPDPISSYERNAFEKMKEHVKDHPDDDLTITIKTPWGPKVDYADDPARDVDVQVRVLRAAVNVIYGKDLAPWVIEEIKAGRIILEIPE